MKWFALLTTALAILAFSAQAEEVSTQSGLEAAASASLGGPGSAQAQQEQDRLRRLESSRWQSLDQALDPVESALMELRETTGLTLSFDYQALYQQSSHSLTGIDKSASGQARIIGNWNLLHRDSANPGSLVFILENRHLLGQEISPASLASQIGYAGATGVTFGDTDTTLSVAYWSQILVEGRAGNYRHMADDKKDALTEEEIKMLKLWVNQDAENN